MFKINVSGTYLSPKQVKECINAALDSLGLIEEANIVVEDNIGTIVILKVHKIELEDLGTNEVV